MNHSAFTQMSEVEVRGADSGIVLSGVPVMCAAISARRAMEGSGERDWEVWATNVESTEAKRAA